MHRAGAGVSHVHHAGMLDRQVEVKDPGVLRWPLRCFNTSAGIYFTWNLALRWSAWHAAYICIAWPHQLQTEPCSPEYITMIPYDFLPFSAFCCQFQCPETSYGHGHMPQARRGKMQRCCHAVQLIDPNGVRGAENAVRCRAATNAAAAHNERRQIQTVVGQNTCCG